MRNRFRPRACVRFVVVLLVWGTITGCAYFGTNAPLKMLRYQANDDKPCKNLIIMLHSRGDSHDGLAKEGFIADLQKRRLPYDIIVPYAHLGYYWAETLVPRLKEDIVEPAKASGYQRICIVGLSMGGLGALMYLRQYPEDIDGVYAIAPFLGYSGIVDEVADQGGIYRWQAGPYDSEKDWQRMFWDFLKTYAEKPEQKKAIYLGYGEQDSFNKAHLLLKEVLPPSRTYVIQGGHDSATMRTLWQMFLDESDLIDRQQ